MTASAEQHVERRRTGRGARGQGGGGGARVRGRGPRIGLVQSEVIFGQFAAGCREAGGSGETGARRRSLFPR